MIACTGEIQIPVAPVLDRAICFYHQGMAGLQLEYVAKQSLISWKIVIRQKSIDNVRSHLAIHSRIGDDCLNLRGKGNKILAAVVVERLNPNAIPREEECFVHGVPY